MHTPISQLGKPTFPIFDNPIWVWLTSQEFSGVFGSFSSGVSHIKKIISVSSVQPPLLVDFPLGMMIIPELGINSSPSRIFNGLMEAVELCSFIYLYHPIYIYIVQFFLIFFSLSLSMNPCIYVCTVTMYSMYTIYYIHKAACLFKLKKLVTSQIDHVVLALREMKLMLEKCGLDDSITLRRVWCGEAREATLFGVPVMPPLILLVEWMNTSILIFNQL